MANKPKKKINRTDLKRDLGIYLDLDMLALTLVKNLFKIKYIIYHLCI